MMYLNHFILRSYQIYKCFLEKVLVGLLIQFIDYIIIVSKHNPLAGRSCIKLPKELNHSKEGLNDVQNFNDNECFKWCLVRYLNLVDQPARTIKIDKDYWEIN